MPSSIDHTNLHRTAKYFMDNGRAASPEAAIELLHQFGLTIQAGAELMHSPAHQIALLTLVNTARRTFLGGVEIVGLPDAASLSNLVPNQSLENAVQRLGGRLVHEQKPGWPYAVIGTPRQSVDGAPAWQLTWEGWRGGVIPLRENVRLAEDDTLGIAPVLAAASCAAEVFAYHAGDHPMAGRRSSGMSLWRPGAAWRLADANEPALAYLPSRLWMIGLGNLGQAFAWLLGCLPFPTAPRPVIVLQDFDSITAANESTSVLTSPRELGRKKTRVVAKWLEARGFDTIIEERRFGPCIRRTDDEPGAALCGVDNALARASLEKAGFGLIVEAGLGAGPQGFRNIFMHTFPASRAAADLWSNEALSASNVEQMPAYQALRRKGVDACGLAQLASRTVAVPFVGMAAGCLVLSELLRRLHGGHGLEVASISLLSLDDVETVTTVIAPYPFGHVPKAAQSTSMPNRGVYAHVSADTTTLAGVAVERASRP
jgi:hypothetical protein